MIVLSQEDWITSSPLDYMWKNVGVKGFSLARCDYLTFALNSTGRPFVAYSDAGKGLKATVMTFDGTNWVNVGNAGFTVGEAEMPFLAISPTDQLYLALVDRGINLKMTVMKFDGNSWTYVGNPGFGADFPEDLNMAFNPIDSLPYIAFDGCNNGCPPVVMKFNGTSWVDVGNAATFTDNVRFPSLAFSPAGQPYLAYSDYKWYSRLSVIKYDGANWVLVGTDHFTYPNGGWYVKMAFNPADSLPNVAFTDGGVANKVSVMKFNGSSWVFVGDEGFSADYANYMNLAFSPSGQPYVAFQDFGVSRKAVVMTYTGGSWTSVGINGVSADQAFYENVAVNASGQPYVAFQDWWHASKATVMKYDSVLVGTKESQPMQISIQPNPASDKLVVDVLIGETKLELSILNFQGQQVLNLKLWDARTIINISPFPSGVYTVKVTGEKTLMLRKFVKL